MGPFSGSAPLREDVRELGLSSESNKTGDYDYAEVTRIMHLHNDYAKFRHSDYAKFRQTVVPLQYTAVGNSKAMTNTLSGRHSGPTTGTGIVIVAISTCGPGRSAMGVLSQTARLVSKTISAAALIFGGAGPGVRFKRHLCGPAPHF